MLFTLGRGAKISPAMTGPAEALSKERRGVLGCASQNLVKDEASRGAAGEPGRFNKLWAGMPSDRYVGAGVVEAAVVLCRCLVASIVVIVVVSITF